MLHGGGHSALSWAVFAVAVTKLVDCRVVAVDIRGHGHTATENDKDLSAATLVKDVETVAHALFAEEMAPPIVLVGHSMGGAIAVQAAAGDVIPSLVGLVVIDIVEGTAMNSLSGMQDFLRGRPQTFNSLEYAIEWSIRSGQLRNVESARVSMPGQLKKLVDAERLHQEQSSLQPPALSHTAHSGTVTSETITEEEEEEGEEKMGDRIASTRKEPGIMQPPALDEQSSKTPQYTWRIDLMETEQYWKEWFTGLSQTFLSCSVPKMIIIAGVDRLDRDMTIAQMQGKFQMEVLSGCGHAVHEDAPDKVANILAEFLIRNKFAQPKEEYSRPFPAC